MDSHYKGAKLRLGIGLGLGVRIADLNQIADLKPSIARQLFSNWANVEKE